MSTTGESAQLAVEFVNELPSLAKGQLIKVSSDHFVIGRARACGLCIDDARISRQHTEIVLEGERYWVADCGSYNGTFLNGTRLEGTQRRILRDGDEIQVGSHLVLRFRDAAATVAESRPLTLRRGLQVGPTREEVYVNFVPLEPPPTEQQFRLLRELTKRPGELVPLDEIVDAVWPEEYARGDSIGDSRIDATVSRLRQRLGRIDPDHDYIERVRGKGLRFVQRK